MFSWLLLESYFNHVSDILGVAKLDPPKRAVLEDKEYKVTDDGKLVEMTSHMPILKRALFILRNFSATDVEKLRKSKIWQDVKTAEDARNGLMHQKRGVELTSFDLQRAETIRRSVVEFIRRVNTAIFRKSVDL